MREIDDIHRRRRRRRAYSPEMQIINDTDGVNANRISRVTSSKNKTEGIVKVVLPTNREEAIWQLLSLFNTASNTKGTGTSTTTTSQQQQSEHEFENKQEQHMNTKTNMEHALKILRLYPALAQEPFYCQNYRNLLGGGASPSWLPLRHFIAANASVDLLNNVIQMYPAAVQTADTTNTCALHVACQLALVDDATVMFLADAYPEALLVVSDPYGYPLHCLLHRQGQKNDRSICLLKYLVDQCPEALLLPDKNGTGMLELAIHRGIHMDKLEYLVSQFLSSGITELKLEEPATTIHNKNNSSEISPWTFHRGQVKVIEQLFPQLKKLTCKVRSWRTDGMKSFLGSIQAKATNVTSLHLDLPDDIHMEHWNGSALQTLQHALTTATMTTLVVLHISLYHRMQGLLDDNSSGRSSWNHDKTFLAIVNALRHENNNMRRLELHNFRLTDTANFANLFASGAAPSEVELVNLSLDGLWKPSPQSHWKMCRLQHLTIQHSSFSTPVVSDSSDHWLPRFLIELPKAPLLRSLTLVGINHTNREEWLNNPIDRTICAATTEGSEEDEPIIIIDLTAPLVRFLRHATKLDSLCVKGPTICVDTPTICKVLQTNTSLTRYNVQGCLQDQESRSCLANLLQHHNRTLVELPDEDEFDDDDGGDDDVQLWDKACKWWHRIDFYLSSNRFRQLGIDLDPAMATSFPLQSYCYS